MDLLVENPRDELVHVDLSLPVPGLNLPDGFQLPQHAAADSDRLANLPFDFLLALVPVLYELLHGFLVSGK